MMETIGVAFGAIRANPLRSFLTMLGMVIGVGAVITMVALGTGAQAAVEEQIQSLGTDLLAIYPGQSFMHGVARGDRVSVTMDDAEALAIDGYALRAVVPEMSRRQQIEYGNANASVNVMASTAEYIEIQNQPIVAGRMFTEADSDQRRRVVVLGSSVPEMLGGNGVAMIGQQLSIRGIPFEIIGLLDEKGAQGHNNPDEQVLIPLKTGQFRVFGTDRLRAITVQVVDQDSMMVAMIGIERVMRREHGIQPGATNDFQIRDRTEFLAAQQETAQTFTFLLGGIAAVSLLVGGIGIMNIMLVSVTERTREIGIRKALGARRRTILLQFLVEAVTLCVVGGTIGVVAGAGTAVALARFQGWNTLVSLESVVVAFVFSAVIGVFFGMWPARRAALMDPIVALGHE
ncbi:MAG: ABC transporter permease [Gemmatimonadetes bacterium]|nr:ABC transporter permease [Gemmatimonadota bacterium]